MSAGYRKHKSGSRGGVGRAGVWGHNKQKYDPIVKHYKMRYIKLAKLLSDFAVYKELGYVFENDIEVLIDSNKFYKIIEIPLVLTYNNKPIKFKGKNTSKQQTV